MISAKQAKEMTASVRNKANASAIDVYLQSLEEEIKKATDRGESDITYGLPAKAIEENVIVTLVGLKYKVEKRADREKSLQTLTQQYSLHISW